MKSMLVRLYLKYVPVSLREKIYLLFLGQLLGIYRNFPAWRKGFRIYLFSPFYPKNEYYDAYRFIGKHGVSAYPFKASLKYKQMPSVQYDDIEQLHFIDHHNKRLYFPHSYQERQIKGLYRSLLIEQDPESSHQYVVSYDELKGKTLLDIGAAEGIFSLDTIDFVNKVYLFECEEEWIKPLQATFKPWKEKVEIVRKYVGDSDSADFVTLDSFMKGKEQDNLFIKMDIEGAEQSALKGAKNLLAAGKGMSFSVCTYHKEDDLKEITSFFESLGYTYELTKGYFFMTPHMRKAICRGNN
ncbi:methyltransferase, FkbM family [Bacteroidales bacterium Barb7]|nr:methyltransferase, FkbM family [Bacteroidales bacterium Barb7]